MVSMSNCVKFGLLVLLINTSLLMFLNTVVYSAHPPAVKERYITRHKRAVDVNRNESNQTEEDLPKCNEESSSKTSQNLDLSKGMWDKSHVFKVHPFVVTGSRWSNLTEWNVCLSTQCSADLLYWTVEQVKTWKGPISVSVFVPDVDYTIVKIMIEYMQICFSDVRERVSFHMVYPDVMEPVYIETNLLEYDCKRPEEVNVELVKLLRTKELIKAIAIARYPQNLMRNTARQGCQSRYCFTPDIDMLSIPGFSENIDHFVTQRSVVECKKCAYVIPTYEIAVTASANPTNKKELQSYLRRKHAQRFHVKVFANNQANTDLEKWEKLSAGDSFGVAYNVTTWKTHWEPIYVTKATVPLFDERFIGYGFTRNSQVYEMHVAGYSWHVLDNAFLTHRGFQSKRSHSKIRRRQIAENNGRYNVFVRELYQRYGVQLDDDDARAALKPSKQSKAGKKTKKSAAEKQRAASHLQPAALNDIIASMQHLVNGGTKRH